MKATVGSGGERGGEEEEEEEKEEKECVGICMQVRWVTGNPGEGLRTNHESVLLMFH